ncbi:MAG: insulinase family protein [Clostridia bacterium]|nr:insulinase family protein [Clostridia bacterium]MCI8964918.1 insulinase family protein [Clostridia bacterium]
MKDKCIDIKQGIKLHLVKTDLFKTNLSVLFITIPLDRTTITEDVIIPEILKSGSNTYKRQIEISNKLDEMYGATLEAGVDKTGKNLVIKLYIESIDDEFLPNGEENLKNSVDTLIDIAFNPYITDEGFNREYVNIEKERRRIVIESQKDDKDSYAYERIISIMYNDTEFGINKNGYLEDIEKINEKSLYNRYKDIIKDGKIDIFIAGNINEEYVKNLVLNNKYINNLNERDISKYLVDIEKYEKNRKEKVENIVEKMDVTQGKLVIGLDVLEKVKSDDRFKILIYNTILGDGANSKLFKNVREKASLAYTCKSNYVVQKSNIFIRAGIEIENYNKALEVINNELDNMRNGKFEDEDLENAKRYIYSGIDAIKEEQNTAIIFFYGEEVSLNKVTIEEYYEKIKNITREDIIEIAKRVNINTIYFLRNNN